MTMRTTVNSAILAKNNSPNIHESPRTHADSDSIKELNLNQRDKDRGLCFTIRFFARGTGGS